MNKKMIVITTERLKDIFSIVGIQQYNVSEVNYAEEIINEKIKDETIGLILIEEEVYKELSARTRFILEKRWEGVITKIPSYTELEIEETYIVKEIKRVLGYQIKIT